MAGILRFLRWRPALGLAAGLLVLLGGAIWFLGLFTVERHHGFLAPVWDPDGRHAYVMERDTTGVVWGLGWEFFSPPAHTYVLSDRFTLRRIEVSSGAMDTLESFTGSPLVGRTTRHYHGRIFNWVSGRIVAETDGIAFTLGMQVPRVPLSEQWRLAGTWREARPSRAKWRQGWAGNTAAPDSVLDHGVELLTVKGVESFPAAVLAVADDGSYRVVARNSRFDALYPDGVPAGQIAERSLRRQIERARELDRVERELVARYRAQGMRDVEARLRAHDEMEERGYFPKSPRLVATAVDDVPTGLRVFDISQQRLRVGLFQDIAAAIAAPGQEVKTDTGSYLRYEDDETGPELARWREAGHDRFAVRSAGRLYVLEVRRFPPRPAKQP